MVSAVIGFPRVGKQRELKFASEKYFRGEINKQELEKIAIELRKEHFIYQKEQGITYISSNDFSYYDGILDTAVLLNVVPECYRALKLNELDTYFAMARGYQGAEGDVKALAMKKWFNTNYHYMVPEISDDMKIELVGDKPFVLYQEAKELGLETKPVIIGPFTFLKLAKYQGTKKAKDFAEDMINAYSQLLEGFHKLGVKWVQFDEPILVTDLTGEDIELFEQIYQRLLKRKGNCKILLQTYFGDVRDCYSNIIGIAFDGIGLDFLEGKKNLELVKQNGFPKDKILFAGLLNGKNIWN